MATLSLQDSSKSPKPIKKFLNKRKTERKASDDENLLRKSRFSGMLVNKALVNKETKTRFRRKSLSLWYWLGHQFLLQPWTFKSQIWVVVLKLTGTVALEEDAQILKVIEAYCTGASLHQTTTGIFFAVMLAFLEMVQILPLSHTVLMPPQLYVRTVSLQFCYQRRRRSLLKRWRATAKQSLRRSMLNWNKWRHCAKMIFIILSAMWVIII